MKLKFTYDSIKLKERSSILDTKNILTTYNTNFFNNKLSKMKKKIIKQANKLNA